MSNVKCSQGFTLVEILIAIGILVIILTLGLFVSFDFYKSYAFSSEKNIIISVLQKARNQSLNNIDQARHGVRFENPLKYIIFECKTKDVLGHDCANYSDADTSKDFSVNPSFGNSVSNIPFDVVFDQLSGDCIASATFNCSAANPIIVSYGAKSYNITINSEGQINWQ